MPKALLRNGQLKACLTHKRKRSYKPRVAQPKNKCAVCWLCWLADRTETLVYQSDMEDFIKFSNAFKTTIKPSFIEYEEERS